MNCKPGDLAVIVRSNGANVGKIIQCIRLATYQELDAENFIETSGPIWVIDKKIECYPSRKFKALCRDGSLRPIRDNPGQDETLTWLDVPSRVTA